jgi:epimerase transport system membrane fusion protein
MANEQALSAPIDVAAKVIATTAPPAPQATDVDALLRGLRRAGLVTLGVWVTGFVLWSVFAPISGAVVGAGLVKVEANRMTVSHRDGGIVARVLVREGQTVKQGETLVVLEDERLDASVDLQEVQLASEQLRRSRLEAEAALQKAWTPPKLAAAIAGTPRVREALQRERSAFDARRRTLAGQMDSFRSQVADTDAEMRARDADARASVDALKLLREELASNEALLKENFVNKARVLTIQRGVAEYESRVQAVEAERLKARAKRTELEGRIASLQDAYVQQATEELRDATARVVDLEERLRANRDTAGRQAIVAPVAGRLVDLKVNTPGSAIGPREPVVDIVPSDVPLVVEAKVAAEAVTDVRPGLEAEVKLLGARQRNNALLLGSVVRVSADALTDARTGAPYFAVQIEVPAEALVRAHLPALLPGMATEVYIKTTERSALQFLMDPLTTAMRRSFREH